MRRDVLFLISILLITNPAYGLISDIIFYETFESGTSGNLSIINITGTNIWQMVSSCGYSGYGMKTGACGINYTTVFQGAIGFNRTMELGRNVQLSWIGNLSSQNYYEGGTLEAYNNSTSTWVPVETVSPYYNTDDAYCGMPGYDTTNCWSGITTYNGFNPTIWQEYTADLTNYVNSTTGFLAIRLRFGSKYGNGGYGMIIDNVKLEYTPDTPLLTPYNSKTLNNTLYIEANTSEVISFNVTSDQAIDTWKWYDNNYLVYSGTGVYEKSFELINNWSTIGINTLKVNATNNTNGSTELTWIINVSTVANPEEDLPSANSPLNITLLGTFPNGAVYDVDTNGSYVFVGDGKNISIWTYTNLSSPILVSAITLNSSVMALESNATMIYVATNDGLRIIDYSTPTTPIQIKAILPLYHTAYANANSYIPIEMKKSGNFIYVGASSYGLAIYDVVNPLTASEIGWLDIDSEGIDVVGNRAYTGSYSGVMRIINISTPSAPVYISNWTVPADKTTRARLSSIRVLGNVVFATNYGNGVHSVNISNENNPIQLGFIERTGGAWGEEAWGMEIKNATTAYVAWWYGGLAKLDITDPINMQFTLLTSNLDGDITAEGYNYGMALSPDGEVAFVAGQYKGANIFNLTNDIGIVNAIQPRFGKIFAMTAYNNAVYLGMDRYTVAIDNSVVSHPKYINQSSITNQRPSGMTVNGNYLYQNGYYSGLKIFDISNPLYPVYTGFYSGRINGKTIYKDGYIYTGNDDLFIRINVTIPSSPTFKNSYDTTGIDAYQGLSYGGFNVYADYAYIVNGTSFQIINISNPSIYTQKSIISIPVKPAYGSEVLKLGDYIYVKSGYKNICVIDVSDVNNPSIITTFEGTYNIESMELVDSSTDFLIVSMTSPKITEIYNLTASTILATKEATYQFAGIPYVYNNNLYTYHGYSDSGYEVYQLWNQTSSSLAPHRKAQQIIWIN